MKRENLKKKLIPTLLATFYTIPGLVGADDHIQSTPQPKKETSKATIASEAVRQEVIQLLRQGGTDRITVNIAGQPGTYFRIYYSQTGQENSYTLVPKGEGAINENGIGSIDLKLEELGKQEVYLKVHTSDKADFSQFRLTPKPLILEVAPVRMQEKQMKGLFDSDRFEVRTPSAVAGVRG